jgi:hypothetical protein
MIRWSDAPFNWPAEPELDEKVLNSPQPCSHGSGCRYNGPCAFVHKGEEGTGRRLFPARMVLKDGKEVKQEAAVRLIGSPSFYERRRLRLSWPEWCAKRGIQQLAAPPKATPAFTDASGAWPSMVAQAQAQVQAQPAQAQTQGKTFASVAAQKVAPASAPLPKPLPQPEPQPLPQEAVFYSYYSNIYQQAIAQHGSIEKALAVACQNMRTASAAAAPVPVPVPTVIPTPVVSPTPADLRNEYGQKLYDKLTTFKEEMMEFMPNWPVTSTPGKIAGMFLELDVEDWDQLLNDESYFEEKVKDALEVLEAAAAYKEEAAAARAARAASAAAN